MRAAQMTREHKLAAVERLYEMLPDVGIENTSINASNIAKDINLTTTQTARVVREMESLGILERRIAFSAKGKESFWKLLVQKDVAIEKMTGVPMGSNNSDSLRNRIIVALKEHGKFANVPDLINYLRKDNENINLHNPTHLLHALRQQGIVMFKVDSSNKQGRARGKDHNVPYDIELGKMAVADSNSRPAPVRQVEPEVSILPEPVPETIIHPTVQLFPLIERVVHQRRVLEQAAMLADPYEPDLAAMLLEKAMTLTDYDKEVIALFSAYIECKGG